MQYYPAWPKKSWQSIPEDRLSWLCILIWRVLLADDEPEEKTMSILNAGEKPVMAIYLKILAVAFLALSGFNFASLLGFGDINLEKVTVYWLLANNVYALFFAVTAVGLWTLRPWGMICFFIVVSTQLVLYSIFSEYFSGAGEEPQSFQGIINFHISTLGIFFVLRIKGK